MPKIKFHIVDVFTSVKYGGNQLAVFVDYDDEVSEENMLSIARELNFSEITFVKKNHSNSKFDVRIFTPEYEVPFAGHPSLGTAFIISKYLIPEPKEQITLNLKHAEILIDVTEPHNIDNSNFIMQQASPEFISSNNHKEIADGLGIDFNALNKDKVIEEISTGLPYIIIPLNSLDDMNKLNLNTKTIIQFLIKNNKYKTNSASGLTTSLFFITEETFEKENNYNTRMFCIEQENLMEDAATGSANGCFLAYLLKNESANVSAICEQGFQMNRKSFVQLTGSLNNDNYTIKIGGQVVDVSEGFWKV